MDLPNLTQSYIPQPWVNNSGAVVLGPHPVGRHGVAEAVGVSADVTPPVVITVIRVVGTIWMNMFNKLCPNFLGKSVRAHYRS